MKHSPLHILSALAVLCAAALNSCTGDGCTDNSSSLPLAHFYQNGKAVTVKLDDPSGKEDKKQNK